MKSSHVFAASMDQLKVNLCWTVIIVISGFMGAAWAYQMSRARRISGRVMIV